MVQKPLYIRRTMSSFSFSRRKGKTATAVATLAAAALVLSGCAVPGNGGAAGGELTLKIGTALPLTGTLAFLGPPEEAGVALAVADVNSANKGITLDVVYGDSGDLDNKAYETEIPRLLSAGVKAILGAASSGVSLQFIDQVTGAGVIQFSPANTSPTFTTYDDGGLYFRTAPSDLLQGEVLGNLIADDGHETLGILTLNDAYGTGLRDATKATFEKAGGKVVTAPLFNSGDAQFTSQINELLAAAPDAIVIIAFDETKTIMPGLVGQFPSENIYFVDGNLANYSTDFPAGTLTGIKGTLPGLDIDSIADFTKRMNDNWVSLGNPDLGGVYAYGPESYDAVVLLALASLAAGSTDSAAIAGKLREVSGGSGNGKKCFSFAECADIINGGGIADYDGVSGPITFDENGDPTEAEIGVYIYKDDNTYLPYRG
jgi:branched-chain amino acid transport system substrate-binding protein